VSENVKSVPEILASDFTGTELNLRRFSISEIKENGKTIPLPKQEAIQSQKNSLPRKESFPEFDRRRATGKHHKELFLMQKKQLNIFKWLSAIHTI